MNHHPRSFEDHAAVRENVPLLVGLMGPSGSGKTYSALRLATGIQQITGGDIYGIDTEARRMRHYGDMFTFRHIDFRAPFGSLDYLQALQHCVKKGAKVIIVDSMSHEHVSPGGYLLTQEAELDRMAGDDWKKRERVKMAAWIKPAGLRQQMINGILQLNCSMIFCFRAKEKVKPIKNAEGKVELVEMGFMPIAGEELLFEMTVNCLLLPKSEGVPTWRSDNVGEKLMMKCPRQFRDLFAAQKPLDESIGKALAEWARGGAVEAPKPEQPAERFADTLVGRRETLEKGAENVASPDEGPASVEAVPKQETSGRADAGPDMSELAAYDVALAEAAKQGTDVLRRARDALPRDVRASKIIKEAFRDRHIPVAMRVDAERDGSLPTAQAADAGRVG